MADEEQAVDKPEQQPVSILKGGKRYVKKEQRESHAVTFNDNNEIRKFKKGEYELINARVIPSVMHKLESNLEYLAFKKKEVDNRIESEYQQWLSNDPSIAKDEENFKAGLKDVIESEVNQELETQAYNYLIPIIEKSLKENNNKYTEKMIVQWGNDFFAAIKANENISKALPEYKLDTALPTQVASSSVDEPSKKDYKKIDEQVKHKFVETHLQKKLKEYLKVALKDESAAYRRQVEEYTIKKAEGGIVLAANEDGITIRDEQGQPRVAMTDEQIAGWVENKLNRCVGAYNDNQTQAADAAAGVAINDGLGSGVAKVKRKSPNLSNLNKLNRLVTGYENHLINSITDSLTLAQRSEFLTENQSLNHDKIFQALEENKVSGKLADNIKKYKIINQCSAHLEDAYRRGTNGAITECIKNIEPLIADNKALFEKTPDAADRTFMQRIGAYLESSKIGFVAKIGTSLLSTASQKFSKEVSQEIDNKSDLLITRGKRAEIPATKKAKEHESQAKDSGYEYRPTNYRR